MYEDTYDGEMRSLLSETQKAIDAVMRLHRAKHEGDEVRDVQRGVSLD